MITGDTRLPAGAVLRRRVVVAADHITLDGRGALLQGPGKPGKPGTYQGTGILVEGCKGIVIRNLRVRGFSNGLEGKDGADWLLEDNDFSGNYDDPSFGWGEGKRAGGMILTRVSSSVFRGNKAGRNWNGLDLRECDGNLVEGNDFSHCSNVCLKLWRSRGNRVLGNDLSFGIRCKPGETHARDSACLLVETGSDGNYFYRNQITHGGDGVFIRALNKWVSRFNVFVENDCSFAHNNCVESWCPDNTYIRNKANHGSYGFWLGGSDHTTLVGNEASFNGLATGNHNAPQPGFGFGGIVIVGGPSSHSRIEGNLCRGNNGAGIAFRGDDATKGKRWRTYHWLVQDNRIENNKWGIWGRWGDWIVLAGNRFKGNEKGNHLEEVSRLVRLKGSEGGARAPFAASRFPLRVLAGRPALFDASASFDPAGLPLHFAWDLGGTVEAGAKVVHTFPRPGFYRVGLVVDNGARADLAFRDFVVTEKVDREFGTEGEAGKWGFSFQNDPGRKGRIRFSNGRDGVVGRFCLEITPDPYMGAYATAIYPAAKDASWDLSGKKALTFWIKARNPNLGGFQEPGPVVRLYCREGVVRLQPSRRRNLLFSLPYSEARWTWMRITVPLSGSKEWDRKVEGKADLRRVKALSFSLDSWGGKPFTLWLDGLTFR